MNDKGVLHVPLALLAVLIVLTGLGLWGLLHRWKFLTQTQLRLDRCTGEAALELKGKLHGVLSINGQIEKFRALEAAASASSTARSALLLAVNAEEIRQEALRVEWMVKRGKWAVGSFTGSNCGSRGDISMRLPALEWDREPPDELGARPLVVSELPASFYFEVKHAPRASAAEVFRGGQDGTSLHARWVQPRELLRTGLY